ncbi:hypothetical protein BH09PLA1_BH09PLA1_23280 [soil metagenome]
MADQPKNPDPKQQSLSDISHLFLSSVRDRQTGGAPRPQRTPPTSRENRTELPVDLTPEEFAQVIGANEGEIPGASKSNQREQESPDRLPPISAVVAPHLNGHQRDRVREYAAHLCKSGERIGLIEIDAAEFRVSCFELGSSETPTESAVCDALGGRRMSETLDELSWDVDRWLLNVPNPRLNEARAILRLVDHWTVLATCDHDGVVACYRSLKGLADVHSNEPGDESGAPTLSLALLDARDELASIRVFRKLSGVCQQFLHWPLESEPPVLAAGSVAEHQVLVCRATRDKSQLASAPQWQVMSDFVMRCGHNHSAPAINRPLVPAPIARKPESIGGLPTEPPQVDATAQAKPKADRSDKEGSDSLMTETDRTGSRPFMAADRKGTDPFVEDLPPRPSRQLGPAVQVSPAIAEGRIENQASDSAASEVIDLPAGADAAGAIVAATLRGANDVIECPVKPPMLADASLAVTRDRRLVLFAVASQGLSDLRSIGEAWRWMNENRVLISMAMPQLQIDPHQMPHLRLLVDRADLSASTLQPLLQTGHVIVQSYRKLRWGEKTGLLLEAA